MADMSDKTNKLRKPFFWRRREPIVAETVRLAPAIEADQPKDHPWWRPTVWKAAGLAVVALMLLPGRANGQFGIDIAAIMAALSKVRQCSRHSLTAWTLRSDREQSAFRVENAKGWPSPVRS